MAWAKNGTPDTLSSSADIVTITDLTAYKFNVFLNHNIQVTDAINANMTFNNDTGSNYARRGSNNGGTDFTSTSRANWNQGYGGSFDQFFVNYTCSIGGEEKLNIGFSVGRQTTGAATAPDRKESADKYVPSPDADITEIDVDNSGAGSYDTDSNLSALGTDEN